LIDAHTIRDNVHARVKAAREAAGSAAWLVGYHVNGIQEYVTANRRPVAMEGASALIKGFDDTQREHQRGVVFTGGGRGLFLVDSDEAARLVEELPRAYLKETVSGVLATARVPWSEVKAADTLRWLRRKLESSKDSARRPVDDPPSCKQNQCDRCREYRAIKRREVGKGEEEHICRRCLKITEIGREKRGDERGQSLAELSSSGFIAAISADGNNLGDLFASLHTLEQTAAVSEAIGAIFQHAHEAAIKPVGKPLHVAPVTGGDDIRVFMPPEHVEGYVSTLVREVEQGGKCISDVGETLDLNPNQRALFAELGVGIGVVVAGDKTSASWLMTLAHTLERSAKTVCRPGTKDHARSALDFAVLTTDEAFVEGVPTRVRGDRGRRPISLEEGTWRKYVHDTRLLANVPAGQRAVLAERAAIEPEEFDNLFRYQVARSEAWQAWYAAIGSDWMNPERVINDCPDASMLEFLRFLKIKKDER
jgi:hypothetical protein